MSLLITLAASLTIHEDLHSLGIQTFVVQLRNSSSSIGELFSGDAPGRYEVAIENLVSQLTQENSLQVESLAE
jgi:hypothetical protein